MATTKDYIEYVCEQLKGVGNIRYRKMFGEYMVYVDDKPVVIVCDNTAFVNMLVVIAVMMSGSVIGFAYEGAKEHYILNIDDENFCKSVVKQIEKITPLPKKK